MFSIGLEGFTRFTPSGSTSLKLGLHSTVRGQQSTRHDLKTRSHTATRGSSLRRCSVDIERAWRRDRFMLAFLLVAIVLALVVSAFLRRAWKQRCQRLIALALPEYRTTLAAYSASGRCEQLRAAVDVRRVDPDDVAFPAEIDMVISGGAFWTTYAGIVGYVLRRHGVTVHRVGGTSGGAFVGLAVLRGFAALDASFCWALAATAMLERYGVGVLEALFVDFFAPMAAPPPADGTLRVGITDVARLRRRVEDRFPSPTACLDALLSSARIPGVMGSLRADRSLALDGSLTDLCGPVFDDGVRPQLVPRRWIEENSARTNAL